MRVLPENCFVQISHLLSFSHPFLSKATDAQNKGWVLAGFPKTAAQASFLRQARLCPSRVISVAGDAAAEVGPAEFKGNSKVFETADFAAVSAFVDAQLPSEKA